MHQKPTHQKYLLNENVQNGPLLSYIENLSKSQLCKSKIPANYFCHFVTCVNITTFLY
jgi:hypothetical protein